MYKSSASRQKDLTVYANDRKLCLFASQPVKFTVVTLFSNSDIIHFLCIILTVHVNHVLSTVQTLVFYLSCCSRYK